MSGQGVGGQGAISYRLITLGCQPGVGWRLCSVSLVVGLRAAGLAGHCVNDAVRCLFRRGSGEIDVHGNAGGQQAEDQQFDRYEPSHGMAFLNGQ